MSKMNKILTHFGITGGNFNLGNLVTLTGLSLFLQLKLSSFHPLIKEVRLMTKRK